MIYYTTFSISLLVTITNSLAELMQISKKFYTYATVKESLTTEGWSFLSLSGKYKHYTDHSECWRKFINKVEKLNTNAIQSNLILSVTKQDETITKSNNMWNQLMDTNQSVESESIENPVVIYTEH